MNVWVRQAFSASWVLPGTATRASHSWVPMYADHCHLMVRRLLCLLVGGARGNVADAVPRVVSTSGFGHCDQCIRLPRLDALTSGHECGPPSCPTAVRGRSLMAFNSHTPTAPDEDDDICFCRRIYFSVAASTHLGSRGGRCGVVMPLLCSLSKNSVLYEKLWMLFGHQWPFNYSAGILLSLLDTDRTNVGKQGPLTDSHLD